MEVLPTWNLQTDVRRRYWYFRLQVRKAGFGFHLQIILPIGALFWRFRFPNLHVYMTPRFSLNWRKSRHLVDGGMLFEKSWSIQ